MCDFIRVYGMMMGSYLHAAFYHLVEQKGEMRSGVWMFHSVIASLRNNTLQCVFDWKKRIKPGEIHHQMLVQYRAHTMNQHKFMSGQNALKQGGCNGKKLIWMPINIVYRGTQPEGACLDQRRPMNLVSIRDGNHEHLLWIFTGYRA